MMAPHIAFAPNAGLAAYRSWLPTLRALASSLGADCPLVVTDYTEEARRAHSGLLSYVRFCPAARSVERRPACGPPSPCRRPC